MPRARLALKETTFHLPPSGDLASSRHSSNAIFSTGCSSRFTSTALKYSSEARLTSTGCGSSANASLSAAVMRSRQKAYRSLPAGLGSFVPISSRYGCIRSKGRSTP